MAFCGITNHHGPSRRSILGRELFFISCLLIVQSHGYPRAFQRLGREGDLICIWASFRLLHTTLLTPICQDMFCGPPESTLMTVTALISLLQFYLSSHLPSTSHASPHLSITYLFYIVVQGQTAQFLYCTISLSPIPGSTQSGWPGSCKSTEMVRSSS